MSLKELKPHLDRKQYIGILRYMTEEEDEMVFGVPVAASKNFLVLQEVSEFYLYGFSIIPMKAVQEVRRDAADAYLEGIMRIEGLMDKIENRHPLDLANWESIFKGLMQTGLTVTIQCEDLGEDYFFIGQIKRVDADAVWIHHFDSEGVLSEAWDDVPYTDITKVGFDEPYANIFSKHLRNLN